MLLCRYAAWRRAWIVSLSRVPHPSIHLNGPRQENTSARSTWHLLEDGSIHVDWKRRVIGLLVQQGRGATKRPASQTGSASRAAADRCPSHRREITSGQPGSSPGVVGASGLQFRGTGGGTWTICSWQHCPARQATSSSGTTSSYCT